MPGPICDMSLILAPSIGGDLPPDALDRLAVNSADTSARRGEIALTRLRYKEAASCLRATKGSDTAGSNMTVRPLCPRRLALDAVPSPQQAPDDQGHVSLLKRSRPLLQPKKGAAAARMIVAIISVSPATAFRSMLSITFWWA
jgi:hypothetical protein